MNYIQQVDGLSSIRSIVIFHGGLAYANIKIGLELILMSVSGYEIPHGT